jgi:hypothetical protein
MKVTDKHVKAWLALILIVGVVIGIARNPAPPTMAASVGAAESPALLPKPPTEEDCKVLPPGVDGTWGRSYEQLSMEYSKCEAGDGEIILRHLYLKWVYVSVCNQSREGYLVQYVNDVELERARRGVKGAERDILKRYPTLAEKKDQIWNQASSNRRIYPQQVICGNLASQLQRASTNGALVIPKP